MTGNTSWMMGLALSHTATFVVNIYEIYQTFLRSFCNKLIYKKLKIQMKKHF